MRKPPPPAATCLADYRLVPLRDTYDTQRSHGYYFCVSTWDRGTAVVVALLFYTSRTCMRYVARAYTTTAATPSLICHSRQPLSVY